MTAEAAIGTTPMSRWKTEIRNMLQMKLGPDVKIDEVEFDRQVNAIIIQRFKDIPATLHNNYKKIDVRTTLYQMVCAVMDKRAILGGDGCLFQHHKTLLSINVPIIKNLQKKRSYAKKMRKCFEKGTSEWIYWENRQKNIKIIINSLYGVTGYMKFHFYNVHLAQSVTATGQAIISAAACGFENFMANNISFVNIAELCHYITNVITDYKDTIAENIDLYNQIPEVEPHVLIKHLWNKSAFNFTKYDADLISGIVLNLDRNCIKLLYYKNNLKAFNDTPYMRNLIRELFDNIDELTLGDEYAFVDAEATNSKYTKDAPLLFNTLKNAYRVMVQYNWPIYDKVRRTRYTDKKAVLYIDTDSNFLGLDPLVRFVCQDIYNNQYADYNNMRFKAVSVFTMILMDVVTRNYVKFTESLNIAPEYGSLLSMKNEFLFTRIAFANVKKRYYGWLMIQEGNLIKEGLGDLEIKGFDFIKAGTKATIRDKYESIIHRILKSEHIQTRAIVEEAIQFKKHVMNEILDGKSEYFKQVTVSVMERYKKPFSIQGVKGVLIWNAFNPKDIMDLPVEIDVVPIKLMHGSTPKRIQKLVEFGEYPDINSSDVMTVLKNMPNLAEFIRKYPEMYARFYNGILTNDNEQIASMECNVIAKPRGSSSMPQWFRDIIDVDKIIEDTVSLLTPVLQSTGVKAVSVGAKSSPHYTNIIAV